MTLTNTHNSRINTIIAILFGCFFCANFYYNFSRVRDTNFVDLRNRVTGSRLMAMHISPYFFKWDSTKPETLRDPFDVCNIKNNMTTSPPSVLWMMQPLVKLDYNSICAWWIVLHYLLLPLIVIPLYSICKSSSGRNLVLLAATALMLSDHWRDSVFRGQSHIILPALLSVTLWLFYSSLRYRFLIAGIVLAIMVWIRPNALLIVPFLFCCRAIKLKPLLAGLCGTGTILAGMTLLLHHELYWYDFYLSCKEWLHNNTIGIKNDYCHYVVKLEGKVVMMEFIPNPVRWQTEFYSLQFFIKKYLHLSIDYTYYNLFFLVTYFIALVICWKKKILSMSHAVLAGLLLYWFSEFTTPIMKACYYYVELFVVVLLLAGRYRELTLAEKILLACSFILPFLKPLPLNMVSAELCTVLCLTLYLARKIIFRKKERTGNY